MNLRIIACAENTQEPVKQVISLDCVKEKNLISVASESRIFCSSQKLTLSKTAHIAEEI